MQPPQHLEGLVEVAVDVELALNDVLHNAVLINHKRHPPGRQPAAQPGNPVRRCNFRVAVADQWIRQVVRFSEARMLLRSIEAHADNFGVQLGNFRPAITEAPSLTSSPRGKVLGEEVQDHVAPATKIA